MNSSAGKLLSTSPLAVAALLLLARRFCERLALPAPSTAQILTKTSASRSAAYELVGTLAALLPSIVKPRGRPPKVANVRSDEAIAITPAVLTYVLHHPGCVRAGARGSYSDGFRHFVIELRSEHEAVEVEAFARAVQVPLGTLKDWLGSPSPPPAVESSSNTDSTPPEMSDRKMARIQTVLLAYKTWDGTFVDFCKHVRDDLLVPYGRNFISHVLQAHGARHAKKRGRNTKDELAMRGAFETFFPGAQWVGDGMQVPVVVNDQRFTFNLELDVDAHTSALVGASVRDEEDSAAVVEAFEDGVATTGAPPEGLLLDNKFCNHSPDIEGTLADNGDTQLMRATLHRAQNKAHVEGAFGLFSQVLPKLVLDTTAKPREIARALITLIVTTWGRTTNHRPRKDRGGYSRVNLYQEKPTVEQVEQARLKLREITKRQELARRTLELRRRPEVLSLLDSHFARLQLFDPKRNIRIAIAGYPIDAIVDGIAIFDAKRTANTLPDGAGARYLFGIVKNVATKSEGEHLARAMLELRLAAADHMLQPLVDDAASLCSEPDVTFVSAQCIDRALESTGAVERAFWLDTLADVLLALPDDERHKRFAIAAHRIYATFAIPPKERQDAVRVLADRIVPIQ